MNTHPTHKNILFPTDFSEVSSHALTFAIEMCEKEKSKLILLHVVDGPFSFKTEDETTEIDLITRDLTSISEHNLEKIKDNILQNHKIEVEFHTYTGDTTQAIERAVNKLSVDRIIMGTKTHKDICFKSSSFILVKNTSVPLLIISSESKFNSYQTILFPFNEKFPTLKKADDVINIAKLYNSKVILLGVSEANTNEKVSIITNHMMYIKQKFDSEKISCEIHFTSSNDYASAILKYADLHKIDLISIANNLPNTLKSSLNILNSEAVINNAHTPVLTIPVRE